MSAQTVSPGVARLAQHAGWQFLSATEALLKGVLESEVPVELIVGPPEGAMGEWFVAGREPATEALLREHGTVLAPVDDVTRAMTLGMQAARASRRAMVLIPNAQLDRAQAALDRACATALDGRGALCVVLEDDPQGNPTACPRRAAKRSGLTCLEPSETCELPQAVELALRLSRAGGAPVGLIIHRSILRSADTMEAHPNRVVCSVDEMIARRKRRTQRMIDSGGWLRVARRLEVNRFRGVPSPGERVPIGFITIGATSLALDHVLHAVGLVGRVPVLRLVMWQPLDGPLVERLLSRCDRAIVLEPRPGVVESGIVEVAEAMRQRAEQPATIWCRDLPPAEDGSPITLGPDDAVHPSILARKVIHLLHAIRPTLRVASRLTADLPNLVTRPAPRGAAMGSAAAIAHLRRLMIEVDQWLRDRQPESELDVGPSALAIDGLVPESSGRRIVFVEFWDDQQFMQEGLAAMRQAAGDGRPWIFVVCDLGTRPRQDLERIINGAVPGDAADRVRVESVELADATMLREKLQSAALREGLTVVLARDGPPSRFNVTAIERSQTDVDRLGFQPLQRLVASVLDACGVRPTAEDAAPASRTQEPEALRSSFMMEKLGPDAPRRWRIRVRPLTEQVEVMRIRPPVMLWRERAPGGLPVPTSLHAQQPIWRAHMAGCRASSLGLAAVALCEAGRWMGYHVRATHDSTRIGPGRAAWAQVVFTRPRTDEPPTPLTATVPYGEADLLIGYDVEETLRAIDPEDLLRVASPELTHAVINAGAWPDEPDDERRRACLALLDSAVAAVTRPDARMVNEFAQACRSEFHTERLTDFALLGAAFQLGLMPVSLEAMERAVAAAEARGYGRSLEAFAFGRHLAIRPELLRQVEDDREEDVRALLRRTVRSVATGGWGSAATATRFRYLAEHALAQMPGLLETSAGREACRELIVGLRHCLAWGGMAYAEQFSRHIMELYAADRGDRGRLLTRLAVLPLAEAMLPRDPFYIAAAAMMLEHRRLIRRRLNVKNARGDRLERRYLTRIEVEAAGHRLRWEARTSDWPARAVAALRRWVPLSKRGTALEQQIRDFVIDFIQRARQQSAGDYEPWCERMRRLRDKVALGDLHDTALSELRMLVERDG